MQRLRAAALVVLFSSLILAYTWWGRFQYQHSVLLAATYLLCGSIVVAGHLFGRDNRLRLGLRLDNWPTAVKIFATFTVPSALALLVLGNAPEKSTIPWKEIVAYCGWALIQQYLLQGFLLLRIREATTGFSAPPTTAFSCQGESGRPHQTGLFALLFPALGAAVLFSLLHFPNRPLAFLTLAAGFAWCLCFSLAPNLPVSWISHALLGSLALTCLKPELLGPFEVGPGGHRYEAFGDGVQVAAGYGPDLEPRICTLPGPDKGHPSLVRVFTDHGALIAEWEAFPGMDFSGRIAVGEAGFGPGDEIVITPGPSSENPPLVRVFSQAGETLAEFTPELPDGYGGFPTIDCGRLFIAPGPGPWNGATVVSYTGSGRQLSRWDLADLPQFVNGIKARPYPLCGKPGSPDGLLLWGTEISVNPSSFVVWREPTVLVRTTLPTTYGLNLVPVRTRAGSAVAVAPGPLTGYPPWVRVFLDDGAWTMIHDWVAFEDRKAAGANLGAVDLDGDGIDELVVGEGCAPGRPPRVRLLTLQGRLIRDWLAY